MTDITRDSLLTTRYRSDSERVTAELALELARLLGDDWTACHGGDEDQARTDAGVARVITAVGGHARDRTVYPRHERIREVQVGSDGKLWKVELCDVTVEQFEAIAVLLSEQAA